jgi:hypothetical protein
VEGAGLEDGGHLVLRNSITGKASRFVVKPRTSSRLRMLMFRGVLLATSSWLSRPESCVFTICIIVMADEHR